MTPKRKKWWDSLPANEKELRESLKTHRRLLSLDKEALAKDNGNAYIAKMIRRQKMLIRAIKHELERGGSCKAIFQHLRCNARLPDLPVYQCSACRIQFWDNKKYSYCPNCGRKIKE